MVTRFVITSLHLAVLMAGLGLNRHKSVLDLSTLTIILTFVIGSFFPVLSSFIQPTSWRAAIFASPSEVISVQLDYLAFGTGLFLGLLLVAGRRAGFRRVGSVAPWTTEQHAYLVGRDLSISLSLLVLGSILYGLYVRTVGLGPLLNRDDYAEKYLVSTGLGYLYFGINLVIAACLWAEAGHLPEGWRRFFRVVAAIPAVWTLGFISVRMNFVLLVAGYAYILSKRHSFTLVQVRAWMVLLLIALYVPTDLFSLFRGAYQDNVMEAVKSITADPDASIASVVGGSELSHPFLTTIELRQSTQGGTLLGSSYLNALPAVVPLAIMPDRPLSLSERFVQQNYLELSRRGGGAGFSLVGEAWWNFGPIIGPLLVGIGLGALMAWVEERAQQRPGSLLHGILPSFVLLTIISHRSEFATIFKQAVSLLMPIIVVSLAFSMVKHLGGRRRTRRVVRGGVR